MTTSPQAEPLTRRVSVPSLRISTKNSNAAVEESLKTYKLLEALRTGDTTALQAIISTYTPLAPSTPNSINSTSASFTSQHNSPSPLILGVQCASTNTIEFIIANFLGKHIDINQKDHLGNTALHYASKGGRIDVIELLLKQKNIDDTIVNVDGKQIIDLAKNQEIADILQANRDEFVEHSASLFKQYVMDSNYSGLHSLFSDPRAAALVDLNHQDPSTGATLLHDSARKRDVDMVKFCIEHGADVSIRDRKGKLAIEVTKDENIKLLLKNITATTSIITAPESNQPPKLKGYLNKWTNYAGGYKNRWFVLENGILSYFKNQDDTGHSCRGSINMKIAKVSIDSSDRQRFDIIGKGSVRYHLRANHPSEAKKWTIALDQSIQWQQQQIRRASLATEDGGIISPTSRNITGEIKPGGEEIRDDVRVGRTESISQQNNEQTSRSRSPSDDSLEVETIPYEDSYQMTISSAKAQFSLQNQLLESLFTILPSRISLKDGLNETKEVALLETFSKSLNLLQNFVEEILRMTEEREEYWNKKLSKELEIKRLWEQSMKDLFIERNEMEQIIQDNVKEEKLRKKQLKLMSPTTSSAEGSLKALKTCIQQSSEVELERSAQISRSVDLSIITEGLSIKTNLEQLQHQVQSEHYNLASSKSLADEYGSDDEFYDAFDDGGSVNEDIHKLATKVSLEGVSPPGPTSLQPYISNSYSGYPDRIRDRLPLDQKSLRPEVSLWNILKNSIGKDLSKITLPVYFNEPTSMLQRMAEDMEYSEILDVASRQQSSTERILYVAAFAMSNYSSTVGRIAKPFNPLLGETYEYVRPDKAFRYISEQVSHHPPISACYCESPNYDFFAEVNVKSKFWGKSFEILPQGVSHVNLKVSNDYWPKSLSDTLKKPANGKESAFMEHYSWKKVTTCVNNLIVGTPWIDHYGDMIITNHLTGDRCVLTFKARGWRGKDAFEIRGYVKDGEVDKEIWEIAGKWNERLVARCCGVNLNNTNEVDLGSDKAAEHAYQHTTGYSKSSNNLAGGVPVTPTTPTSKRPIILLWKKSPTPEEPIPFNLTPFAITLNDLPDSLVPWIAPSDSRMRPDQRAMELGNYDLASIEKKIERDTGESYWEFNHEYWKERNRAGKEKVEGSGQGKWTIDDDIF
ncbi:6291_t:CDS:2 [Funneliformis geosporum]|uniref:8373_t:CDS:1 n=1 Tax=Funneliformis geosporum TaxID=1117311 RepID=A0A9W4SXI1_9GLOM|nr:8373_t:CDS:2 [Funneliformis geosporum]CAI2185374.1 6291_t:CDS:2 [Funneliformis geosporum]